MCMKHACWLSIPDLHQGCATFIFCDYIIIVYFNKVRADIFEYFTQFEAKRRSRFWYYQAVTPAGLPLLALLHSADVNWETGVLNPRLIHQSIKTGDL